MQDKTKNIIWMLALILVAVLTLAACAGTVEERIETGADGTPCKVVDGIPLAPDIVDELTDAATAEVTNKLVDMFKTNTGVATVQGQAYVTEDGFIELKSFYENLLQPGWVYRQEMTNQFSDETAEVAAWSSCIGELVFALFYEDIDPKGNVLVVIYAKP